MPQWNEGQRLKGSDGNIYVVQGGVPVLDQPAAPIGGIVTKGPDPTLPYQGRKAAADATVAEGHAAATPADIQKAQADARRAAAEARLAEINAAQGGQGRLTAEVRAEALKQYNSAQALGPQIDQLQQLFNSGPGSTHGIMGLADFLPFEDSNAKFNAAADRLRGPVINAFGFTSGQSNTPGEVKMNIGGYIPSSSDWTDSVSQDKIQALRGLQKNAVAKAVSILGGVPDAQGNIHPVNGSAGGMSKRVPSTAGFKVIR